MNLNYLKAGIAALGLLIVAMLMMTHIIAPDAGLPLITMVLGYAIGNGIASAQGMTVEPLFQRKQATEAPTEAPTDAPAPVTEVTQ